MGTALSQDEQLKPRALALVMTGMPADWEEEEIIAFLQQQKWQKAKVITRQIRRKQQQWIVSAEPPEPSSSLFWTYEDATNATRISLAPAPQRKFVGTQEPAKAPKKGWSLQQHNQEQTPADKPQREGRSVRRVEKQEKELSNRDRTRSREKPQTETANSEPRWMRTAHSQKTCSPGL